jgi:hypothetical protein
MGMIDRLPIMSIDDMQEESLSAWAAIVVFITA